MYLCLGSHSHPTIGKLETSTIEDGNPQTVPLNRTCTMKHVLVIARHSFRKHTIHLDSSSRPAVAVYFRAKYTPPTPTHVARAHVRSVSPRLGILLSSSLRDSFGLSSPPLLAATHCTWRGVALGRAAAQRARFLCSCARTHYTVQCMQWLARAYILTLVGGAAFAARLHARTRVRMCSMSAATVNRSYAEKRVGDQN